MGLIGISLLANGSGKSFTVQLNSTIVFMFLHKMNRLTSCLVSSTSNHKSIVDMRFFQPKLFPYVEGNITISGFATQVFGKAILDYIHEGGFFVLLGLLDFTFQMFFM